MSQFRLIEVKSNNGNDYFIEGYVSTVDPDFVNDIVDDEGQKATYREILNSDITMDEDHNEWRDPETGKLYDGKKNKYPIARVVDARLDSKGTWVKAKLNKFHPEFDERILPMVREKMLHSFSIAYKVTKYFDKMIQGVKYRVIQGLKLANIAITGNPINKNATFNMALKSFPKMVEENKETVENQTPEVENSETSNDTEVKGMDYKKMYEDLKAEYDKMKKEMKAEDSETERGRQPQEEGDIEEDQKKSKKEMKSLTSEVENLKSDIESLKKENAELKSFVESPQLKSIVESKSVEPQTQQAKKISMWDVC